MGGAQSELLLAIKQDLEGGKKKRSTRKCQVHSLTFTLVDPLTAFSPESPNELQAKRLFPK